LYISPGSKVRGFELGETPTERVSAYIYEEEKEQRSIAVRRIKRCLEIFISNYTRNTLRT
jgi:hypothetical protein